MDLRAIAATATPTPTTSASTPPTDAAATTGTQTAKKSFATLFSEAKQTLETGEKLTHVKGHPFARIKGGERDDQCVNLCGNERTGKVFDLIWRDGRCFHDYGGKGADHVVVEVASKKQAASKAPTGGTSAP